MAHLMPNETFISPCGERKCFILCIKRPILVKYDENVKRQLKTSRHRNSLLCFQWHYTLN